MPDFIYTARTSSGQPLNGTLAAASVAEAIQQLRAEGKYPLQVRPVAQARADGGPASSSGIRISRSDLIQLSTQLAMMVETGVTLTDALDCISKQTQRPGLQALVADVAERIQGGSSFSDAIARHGRTFPSLYIALIRASEKSGQLPQMLNRATTYLRDEADTIHRVRGAMIYPGIMLSFAVSATVFLLAFVLPRFTVIYASKAAALPLPTKILMALSAAIVGYWPWIIAAAAALSFLVYLALRHPVGLRAWHYIQLNMPLFGPMYQKVHLSRGLRMIGTMAASGVSLMDCVSTAQDLCLNGYFRQLWKRIADEIQVGRQLSDPLFESPLVPRSVAQMVFAGEKAGKIGHVMEQIATFAEQELKDQIASLTRYIEPIMIIIMGFIIGGICLALLLPIFTISKVMTQ